MFNNIVAPTIDVSTRASPRNKKEVDIISAEEFVRCYQGPGPWRRIRCRTSGQKAKQVHVDQARGQVHLPNHTLDFTFLFSFVASLYWTVDPSRSHSALCSRNIEPLFVW